MGPTTALTKSLAWPVSFRWRQLSSPRALFSAGPSSPERTTAWPLASLEQRTARSPLPKNEKEKLATGLASQLRKVLAGERQKSPWGHTAGRDQRRGGHSPAQRRHAPPRGLAGSAPEGASVTSVESAILSAVGGGCALLRSPRSGVVWPGRSCAPQAACCRPAPGLSHYGQQQPRRRRWELPGAAGGPAPAWCRPTGPAAAAERSPQAGCLRQAGQCAATVGQREDHEPKPDDPHQHPFVALLQGAALWAQDLPWSGGRDLFQGEPAAAPGAPHGCAGAWPEPPRGGGFWKGKTSVAAGSVFCLPVSYRTVSDGSKCGF